MFSTARRALGGYTSDSEEEEETLQVEQRERDIDMIQREFKDSFAQVESGSHGVIQSAEVASESQGAPHDEGTRAGSEESEADSRTSSQVAGEACEAAAAAVVAEESDSVQNAGVIASASHQGVPSDEPATTPEMEKLEATALLASWALLAAEKAYADADIDFDMEKELQAAVQGVGPVPNLKKRRISMGDLATSHISVLCLMR